jgi:hypothetical protein
MKIIKLKSEKINVLREKVLFNKAVICKNCVASVVDRRNVQEKLV